MANLSKTTNNHGEIRKWAEERGGKPSHVKDTGSKDDIGILRIDFPGYSGEGSLEEITWDQFFAKFDERGLSLIYQEETAEGERSNFNKLVSSETAASEEGRGTGRSKKSASKKNSSARSGASKKSAAAGKKSTSVRKVAANRSAKSAAGKRASSATGAKKSRARSANKKASRPPAKKKGAAVKNVTTKKTPAKKTVAKKGATKKRR